MELITKIENYIRQLDDHQRKREAALLLKEALDELKKSQPYKEAIQNCLDYANGHQYEWSERAVNAFMFLEKVMDPDQ